MSKQAIGKRLHDLRKSKGLTLTELGKRVGLSQPQLSRLESGAQGLRSATLLRIAKALDVKPVYFFLEQEGESAEDPPYGFLAGGNLMKALKSAEFVQLVEQIADAYLHRADAFKAVKLAAGAILGSVE